ncbi:hypothetical protein P2Q00_05910 [Streptomyces coacervatus]|uniref:hypothetical protein n=1 Tax=Streptomyces coacervatus TaxID=647381 RepID=UPI0023DCE42B|nr:hypothetical protein [Streptomyces coacervatus]MDF2264979.1 hypothetical protein [Streptomyces coacervatus]
MIRVMVGGRVQRRSVPSALLIGLILLVAPHLLGALHGPGFLGPQQPLINASAAQSVATAEEAASGSDHDHGDGHESVEDFVPHPVDRVRDSADHPVPAPQLAGLVISRPVTRASVDRVGPRDGVPWPPGGRSACARHCLWRQ